MLTNNCTQVCQYSPFLAKKGGEKRQKTYINLKYMYMQTLGMREFICCLVRNTKGIKACCCDYLVLVCRKEMSYGRWHKDSS